jgi:hypothetical protein
MTQDHYKASLRQAKQDLGHAVEELGETQAKTEELETQIADLRQVVAVLSKLCGEEMVEIEDALGLTDSIRKVMRSSNEALTAQAVRLRLEADGFNTRKYGNLLASIHTVLKRLAEKGQIAPAGTTADGKAAFKWITRLDPPPNFGETVKNFSDLADEKEQGHGLSARPNARINKK